MITNNYNIFTYAHKKIIPKQLENFRDDDFKMQIVLNSKKSLFTKYDLIIFYKHIRNINLNLNKLSRTLNNQETYKASIKNSFKFLYTNYLESFIDSIIAHYFQVTIDEKKQKILNILMIEVIDEIY